jgi:hypothetical protein
MAIPLFQIVMTGILKFEHVACWPNPTKVRPRKQQAERLNQTEKIRI